MSADARTTPAAAATTVVRRESSLHEYRWWMLAVALLIVLPHCPGLRSEFARSLLSQMGIATVFALSYNLLLGQTGLLSFGHAVYFGLGGFAAIHLMRAINAGVGIAMPWVPLAGAGAGLVFGLCFGAVTTRRAGVVFALISLGVGELVFAALRMSHGVAGGEEGITANRAGGPSFFGLTFASQLQVYYLIVAWAVVAAWLMYAFTRTPVGRMCKAIRDNPERASFVGYNPQRVRLIVFTVAATFAGLAGGLHAVNYEIVAADSAGAARSGMVLLMVYIGGEAYFVGAILGAIVLTWLQVSLSDYTAAWQLYLGLFFMAIVLFAPGGLAGLIMMHAAIRRTRAFRSVIRMYLLAAIAGLVMLIGVIALIEINYRLSTQPESAAGMTLFGIGIDTVTPWPWIVAVLLAVGGFLVFRLRCRHVAAAWRQAVDEVGTMGNAVATR
jgi:branched-chain amino acid transport system permease protein